MIDIKVLYCSKVLLCYICKMQFLTDTLVAILTGYLAFTNLLADQIYTLLPANLRDESAEEAVESDLGFSVIPSRYSTDHFTDILRRSAEYQRAALIEGTAPLLPAPALDPREATVNISCVFTTDTTIRGTNGTGFIVHPSGVVMTNAHVAQYLLLAETAALGEAECILRQSTDVASYRADLLYLPPAWIQANAALITEEVPMGTGERDYALLYITNRNDNNPLPAAFPFLSLNTELLPKSVVDSEVEAVGYPAPGATKPGDELPVVLATTTISELYTYGSNYADVFSLRGSRVGASGASGGPVLAGDGSVLGMITTRGNDDVDGAGSLRAISISHIARTIEEETGFSLERNIAGDVHYRATIFKETVSPLLLTLLTNELN